MPSLISCKPNIRQNIVAPHFEQDNRNSVGKKKVQDLGEDLQINNIKIETTYNSFELIGLAHLQCSRSQNDSYPTDSFVFVPWVAKPFWVSFC